MEPAAPSSSSEMPPAALSLSVWHLFALTAGVAAVFGLARVLVDPIYAGAEFFSFDEDPVIRAISLAFYGLMLGGTVIAAVALLRDRTLRIEPGHALLLLGALQFVHLVIGWREVVTWPSKPHDGSFPLWFVVRGCVAAACAWLAAPRWYWRILFLLWSLEVCLVLLALPSGHLTPDVQYLQRDQAWWRGWSPIAAAIALAAGGLADLRRDPRPDWLHWFGLGTLLAFEVWLAIGRGIFV